jgi:hypothetical protein
LESLPSIRQELLAGGELKAGPLEIFLMHQYLCCDRQDAPLRGQSMDWMIFDHPENLAISLW